MKNSWQYRWSWQLFRNYPRLWWRYQTERIGRFAIYIVFLVLWTNVLAIAIMMVAQSE